MDFLEKQIQRYQSLISCVLFFGSEWQMDALQALIQCASTHHLSTCLYTGLEEIPQDLYHQLTYVKLGRWKQELGELSSPNTNQRFIRTRDNQLLNHLFRRPSSCCN